MSTITPTYTPGDTANGYILTPEGTWVPAPSAPAPVAKKPGKGMKIAIGIVAAITLIGVGAAITSGGEEPAQAQTTVSAPAAPSNSEIVEGYITVSGDLSEVFFDMSEATTPAEMEAGAQELLDLTEQGLALPDNPAGATVNTEWDAAMEDFNDVAEAILSGDYASAMDSLSTGNTHLVNATEALPTA